MGAKKNTAEFTLTNPSKTASKGRTYAIYCAVGVDVQEVEGLTNKMAHEYLNRANGGAPYEVREEVLQFEGARAAKQDVSKKLRHFKKAKSKTTAKSKSESSTDETASLMALLKSRPGLLKKILAKMEAEEGETEEPKPPKKAPVKTPAKPKTPAKAKKGTKVNTKNGANVTIADDDTISDDDLLKMLGKAMGA